jgi:hypothetical protein
MGKVRVRVDGLVKWKVHVEEGTMMLEGKVRLVCCLHMTLFMRGGIYYFTI